MEEKTIINKVNVSFLPVKNGELAITTNELLLYTKASLFSPRSLVKRLPLAAISGVKLTNKQKIKLEGTKESGEVFIETISFEHKSEADKVLNHLKTYLEEKARKIKVEEEEKAGRQREQERKEKKELYTKYIQGNLLYLWNINHNLFLLCTSIPQAEWDNIKEISDALETELESFLKLNGLDRESKIANFKELAEKEELIELEQSSVYLLQYLSGLLNKNAPSGSPLPINSENLPKWGELKFFFLYTALLGEAGMVLRLDEPGELFEIAAKLELLAPIMEQKFGLIKDKSLAASLRLPRKPDEASATCQKLVAEVEIYLKQIGERQE